MQCVRGMIDSGFCQAGAGGGVSRFEGGRLQLAKQNTTGEKYH